MESRKMASNKDAAVLLIIKNDENETDNMNKLKKIRSTAVANTKRAALGELQNRGLPRDIAANDTKKKDVKDIKQEKTNVKPKIDSYWKKTTLAQPKTTKMTISTQGIVGGQQKILTRSNSLKTLIPPSRKTGKIGTRLVRQESTENLSLQHKVKLEKVKENKVQLVKGTDKTKEQRKDKATSRPVKVEQTQLKSQAVLSREGGGNLKKHKNALTDVIELRQPLKCNDFEQLKSKEATHRFAPSAGNTQFGGVATNSSIMSQGVEDIDVTDRDNLLLVSEYVNDIYSYLYSLENEFPIKSNHLEGQLEVFPKMRVVLIDWINEVHLQFHLAIETYQMAISIIDRYLQCVNDTKRKHLQLVGVTSLFIAAKFEELYPPLISDFVYITDDTYTAQQILQMEMKILKALEYNLSRPLPIHFLRRFSKAAKAEDRHHTMSKYFLELASTDYNLASNKPSEVAAASLFLSLNLLNDNSKNASGYNDQLWTPTLEWFSRYKAPALRPICQKIAVIARNARESKLKAVFMKYQSSKFEKMSQHPSLYSPLMDSLTNAKEVI